LVEDNSSGFEAFFRKHLAASIHYVVRLGFPYRYAEDAVEEAMVSLCDRWEKIQFPVTWIRRTAYFHAMNAAKDAKAGPSELIDADMCHRPELSHYDDDPVLYQESLARVKYLLDGLPPRRRAVLSWWLDGFDDQEIARELEIAPDTVRSHRRHALKDIAAKLMREEAESD
jgi:RNA polymerase sigma factor (sigma-70 family)